MSYQFLHLDEPLQFPLRKETTHTKMKMLRFEEEVKTTRMLQRSRSAPVAGSKSKMDEDIKNLQLDKPARGKSIEQLQKHTLDSTLENKPVERGLFLLTKGDDIQKLSVIQALPQLLKQDPQAAYGRLISKIQQELPNASCEFHVATSKVFRLLIEKQVPVYLLNSVLLGVDSRDPIVSNAWMETLLSIIPLLTESEIKNEIIPVAINRSRLNYTTQVRVSSCKIIGRVAVHPKMEPLDVKKDLLPTVHSLCQDCHYEVRASMCSQLPFVAQGLGSFVKTTLLANLVELASDDNMHVRSASIGSIVQMFPYLTIDVKRSTIVPLVKQLCEKSLSESDMTAGAVAKEYGRLLEGMQTCLTVADSTWFLQTYKKLAHRGLAVSPGELQMLDASQDVLCRQQCAYNLPAAALFTLSEIPGQLDVMYSIFHDLACDPCYIVRRTVAGGIHEVTRILASQNKMIKADLVRLLRDDAEEVLQTLVPHMGNTLEMLCNYGTISRENANQATVEIGRALLKCHIELTKGINWRLQTRFLHQLEYLPNCIPSDFIHQHFTPLVLNSAISGKARPVRLQAAKTLLMFLRYNIKETHRKWLRDNLINQLCYSSSCYTRHIYVKMCKQAMGLFSEKYFKEYFFIPLVSLADDPISNIRYCFVSLLPSLKQMVFSPDDRRYKSLLDSAISKIENLEKDRDVLEYYKSHLKEINAPILNKEEHMLEEKRRQDEEDRITFGKIVMIATGVSRGATNRSSKKEVPSRGGTVASITSSHSTPHLTTETSAMTFLEQHFYIDAGMNLPMNKKSTKMCFSEEVTTYKPTLQNLQTHNVPVPTIKIATVSANNIFVEKVTENDLKFVENTTTNITDDVKVNLRKINKTNAVADKTQMSTDNNDKTKRHSSILSLSDSDLKEKKQHNRRSLNINLHENSRIPVSLKNTKQKPKENSRCQNVDQRDLNSNVKEVPLKSFNKSSDKTSSLLPVYTKRSQDVRK